MSLRILRTYIPLTAFLSIFFCATIEIGYGQHTFLTEHNRSMIRGVDNRGYIILDTLRILTDFLTNRDVKELNGLTIPKRKKALIRHVKQTSETLEEHVYDKVIMNDTIRNILLKLEYMKASLLKKAEDNASPFPSLEERIEMGRNSRKSKTIFRYDISLEDNSIDPISLFWSPVDIKAHKQFKKLAKSKKIKASKHMVVLFEELSNSGSAPKIRTLDLDFDNEWSLKWGDEVHTDVVGSRIFAALGYDVDHPYFFDKKGVTLVFDNTKEIKSWQQVQDSLFRIYGVSVEPFVYKQGKVTTEMANSNEKLSQYVGYEFVQFVKCALEARPDRVKRLGSFLPDTMCNSKRRELRGAILAHAFIGNWDTREQNTLLTNVHEGSYVYHTSAVFSDLGSSFGVKLNVYPIDFKVGLVNHFDWEAVVRKRNRICLKNKVNAIPDAYRLASYSDLEWMAIKIVALDSTSLRKLIVKAGWPKPIEELYFHKLASRRASIGKAFELDDPHPILFNKKLTIRENGITIIKKGKLNHDYDRKLHPESFLSSKGRKRNYGN